MLHNDLLSLGLFMGYFIPLHDAARRFHPAKHRTGGLVSLLVGFPPASAEQGAGRGGSSLVRAYGRVKRRRGDGHFRGGHADCGHILLVCV